MMSLLIQKFINAKNSKWKSLLFFFSKFTFIIIWVILLEIERKMYIWFEKVGKLIAKQRNAKEMTQEQLAERLRVDRTTISKWERAISTL